MIDGSIGLNGSPMPCLVQPVASVDLARPDVQLMRPAGQAYLTLPGNAQRPAPNGPSFLPFADNQQGPPGLASTLRRLHDHLQVAIN